MRTAQESPPCEYAFRSTFGLFLCELTRWRDRIKLLIGELQPVRGQQSRNGRLRIACASAYSSLGRAVSLLTRFDLSSRTDFAQHHIDSLDLNVNSVAYLQRLFPGLTEQQYRSHLGAFGITVRVLSAIPVCARKHQLITISRRA